LGGGDHVLHPVPVLVGRLVEATELIVDEPGVVDIEGVGARGNGSGELQGGPGVFLVIADTAHLDR